ncbi:hypothetical protein [Vitiosangium sp. GDMCC 1.1324]|uniref:hypothetical protein n=1 Tax=Vitiosangium sp. (strain GDMCC 1.1324) TaxID=2138576 RepID=UPI001E2E0237|nr:hypothetical protein [Vitiosangium sp. GDMCC 1.1324]
MGAFESDEGVFHEPELRKSVMHELTRVLSLAATLERDPTRTQFLIDGFNDVEHVVQTFMAPVERVDGREELEVEDVRLVPFVRV